MNFISPSVTDQYCLLKFYDNETNMVRITAQKATLTQNQPF